MPVGRRVPVGDVDAGDLVVAVVVSRARLAQRVDRGRGVAALGQRTGAAWAWLPASVEDVAGVQGVALLVQLSPASSTTSSWSLEAKVRLSRPVCALSPRKARVSLPVAAEGEDWRSRKTAADRRAGAALSAFVSPVSVK